ncbi:MAG TPA: FmdB family zinc ribbon protein [Gaiellaceae bacterium]|jgi:putative FmdB family regulatory protein|nr:FmdB family zinc ribbon protein [Gaiellaceae bacterium]
MPIYEYRCPNGHTFELFQRIADAPPSGCEVCGAGPVEKVLFPVAVHFKGSGFYSTDYGKGARKGKDGEPAAATKEGGGADSKAADAKPASDKKAAASD